MGYIIAILSIIIAAQIGFLIIVFTLDYRINRSVKFTNAVSKLYATKGLGILKDKTLIKIYKVQVVEKMHVEDLLIVPETNVNDIIEKVMLGTIKEGDFDNVLETIKILEKFEKYQRELNLLRGITKKYLDIKNKK